MALLPCFASNQISKFDMRNKFWPEANFASNWIFWSEMKRIFYEGTEYCQTKRKIGWKWYVYTDLVPSARCSLWHFPLPIVYCSLLVAHSPLSIVHCPQFSVHCYCPTIEGHVCWYSNSWLPFTICRPRKTCVRFPFLYAASKQKFSVSISCLQQTNGSCPFPFSVCSKQEEVTVFSYFRFLFVKRYE